VSQTVDRALSLLEQIAAEPQSLGMLADHLGVHKSTALRLVGSLERAGLARRREDGRYTLGTRLLSIASKALENFDLRDVARPYLSRLNDICGHTVHLASLIDGDVVYIDKYEGRSSIRMYSRIGKIASLYASGVGKVILAYQVEPHLGDLIASIDFKRHTSDTITSEHGLRKELALINERGYGFDRGEFEDIIHCIAAPIRAADGSVASAVSISVPKMLVSMEDLKELLPDLIKATDAVSHDYGWSGP
jgi:DNA-binding IclR family transcriptional regulator